MQRQRRRVGDNIDRYRQKREQALERRNRDGDRREEEKKEEKGLSFPGNRLGVYPAPIGSQLVGISSFPTVLRNHTFCFFLLLSLNFSSPPLYYFLHMHPPAVYFYVCLHSSHNQIVKQLVC